MVTIAHDHFLRVLYFLEFLSKEKEEYRLPASVIQRLNVSVLAGHELPAYMLDRNLVLYADDNSAWKVPCREGACGVYGEACCLFALPNGNPSAGAPVAFKLDELAALNTASVQE